MIRVPIEQESYMYNSEYLASRLNVEEQRIEEAHNKEKIYFLKMQIQTMQEFIKRDIEHNLFESLVDDVEILKNLVRELRQRSDF